MKISAELAPPKALGIVKVTIECESPWELREAIEEWVKYWEGIKDGS